MLILIIVVLLLANIATLVLLLNNNRKSHHKQGNRMKEYLKKDVGFDVQQLASYDSTFNIHQEAMKGKMKESRKGVHEAYQQLVRIGFTDSALDATSQQVSLQHAASLKMMLKHLGDVRNLCNQQQVQYFDTTIHKMFQKRNRKKK